MYVEKKKALMLKNTQAALARPAGQTLTNPLRIRKGEHEPRIFQSKYFRIADKYWF